MMKHEFTLEPEGVGRHALRMGPVRYSEEHVLAQYSIVDRHVQPGGAAMRCDDEAVLQAVTLFCNSVFGIAARAGISTDYAGVTTINATQLDLVPAPNFNDGSQDSARACRVAAQEFTRLSGIELQSMRGIVDDEGRREFDAVVAVMLGVDLSVAETQEMLDDWRVEIAGLEDETEEE